MCETVGEKWLELSLFLLFQVQPLPACIGHSCFVLELMAGSAFAQTDHQRYLHSAVLIA